jgi:hypothetical protein
MRASPVDLIGGFYADDTLPWSCQDTVNWLPVMAEVGGTRTPSKLATPPGLKPYQRVGTGPIRGMHDLEGAQFVVSGRYLYQIGNSGVAIPIGVIPGVGRVSMTHNQFKTGYQLLVENGQGGGGYIYDSNTKAFSRITDEGYPGSISSDYLDSYLLGVEPQGRYWFHSNLADATDYNTLDRYESEASPDKIVGLAVSQLEVVVFNQRTIEFFYNAGGATGTFQNRRQSITRGCASRHTIAKLDNTLFWLGDDGIVYRLEGYSARPISTGPMHRAFAGKNWSEAFAQVWEDRGFKVYYLTFPDGMTFGYDVVSGLWTRRESFGLNRWRLSHIVRWGAKWYGGDYQDGRNWELDWDYFLEGSDPMVSERVSPVLSDNQSMLLIPSAELIFDTGQGPETIPTEFPPQPSSPTLSGDAPDTLRGIVYTDFTYTIAGGESPYTVVVSSGSLPPGLSISSSGVISGTATASGMFKYTLRVTDAKGLWTELADSIGVSTQVLALGATAGNTKIVTRRNLSGTWSNVNAGTAAGSTNLEGLASGRFIAWIAGAAFYSDDSGSNWTQSASTIDSSGGSRNGDSLGAVVVLGGGLGAFYVSTNSGTTYATRTATTTFLGNPLIVKAGPNTGRILLVNSLPTSANSYSDDQGVTFGSVPAHGVTRSSGGSTHSSGEYQYIGGNVAAGGKPRVAVMQGGSTLLRTLTLAAATNGTVSAILRYPMGSGQRLLMGTSTGELWASDDNAVTAIRIPLASGGAISGLAFDGARLLLSSSSGSMPVRVSADNGVTWVTESNPSTGGITSLAGLPNG